MMLSRVLLLFLRPFVKRWSCTRAQCLFQRLLRGVSFSTAAAKTEQLSPTTDLDKSGPHGSTKSGRLAIQMTMLLFGMVSLFVVSDSFEASPRKEQKDDASNNIVRRCTEFFPNFSLITIVSRCK